MTATATPLGRAVSPLSALPPLSTPSWKRQGTSRGSTIAGSSSFDVSPDKG